MLIAYQVFLAILSTPNWHVRVDRGGAQDYLVEKGMYDDAAAAVVTAKPSSQKKPTHTTHELFVHFRFKATTKELPHAQ